MSPGRLRHRSRTGQLLRVAKGTFVVAGAPATWQRDAMVACLAGPEGTVASHLTAVALFSLGDAPGVPHVTVPRRASGRIAGAVVHRSSLPSPDVTAVDGVPVTGVARTVVDCAAGMGHDELCELVDDVLCRPLCTPAEMWAAMSRAERGPGRAGMASLERALAVWTPGPRPGSRAEMRLVRRLVGWGYPIPQRQVKVFTPTGRFVGRVDLGWESRRVGVEYYGERHHGPRARAHDEARLARIEAEHWAVTVVRKADLSGPGSTGLRHWLTDHLA